MSRESPVVAAWRRLLCSVSCCAGVAGRHLKQGEVCSNVGWHKLRAIEHPTACRGSLESRCATYGEDGKAAAYGGGQLFWTLLCSWSSKDGRRRLPKESDGVAGAGHSEWPHHSGAPCVSKLAANILHPHRPSKQLSGTQQQHHSYLWGAALAIPGTPGAQQRPEDRLAAISAIVLPESWGSLAKMWPFGVSSIWRYLMWGRRTAFLGLSIISKMFFWTKALIVEVQPLLRGQWSWKWLSCSTRHSYTYGKAGLTLQGS